MTMILDLVLQVESEQVVRVSVVEVEYLVRVSVVEVEYSVRVHVVEGEYLVRVSVVEVEYLVRVPVVEVEYLALLVASFEVEADQFSLFSFSSSYKDKIDNIIKLTTTKVETL